MRTRIIVSAIIHRDGKYLFGKKPKDVGPYPNTWHLIGGGAEVEKETLEEAMRREIREETGIEVTNLKPIYFADANGVDKHNQEVRYLFHVYHLDYKNGELTPGDDIAEVAWFSKEEIKELPLPEPTIKLFQTIDFFN